MNTEKKVNILMVDDEPSNLAALEAILECLGQNLIKASSGKEALRYVLNEDFAVILLDVQNARHERHRDGGFDPRTRTLAAYSNHFFDRHGENRRDDVQRIFRWRRGLFDETNRLGRFARQGRSLC
ncbi:MAG: response regulator [Limisphaerales bacterium]